MALPRMRPTLELSVPMAPDALRERIRRAVQGSGGSLRGMFAAHEVELLVAEEAHRLWSPQLALRLEEREPGHTRVHGRFGPQPHLWGLVVALYALAVFLATGGLMLGWSQYLVEEPAVGLWALPLALLPCAAAYGSSLLGQRLGAEQMEQLEAFLRKETGLE